MGLRILVVGAGGREHAIVWKLSQSKRVGELICAPGNAGIAALAECVAIPGTDLDAVVRLASERRVDLVVVGPEDPLAAGLADRLVAVGIPVAGHSAAATRIESSKAWAKELMAAAGIPTARSIAVTDREHGLRAIDEIGLGGRVVVKADGLAAGKGVTVAADRAEAVAALGAIMEDRVFGAAGSTVLIEEFLAGPEVSILALTDGDALRVLAPARDHKRAFDGDAGPNTGGMGAFAPTRIVDDTLLESIREGILAPAVREMAARGTPLRGVLFAGLVLTSEGPRVIEFNARFGDPETQVVLPMLTGDLCAYLTAVATGTLATTPEPTHDGHAVGVVLASAGYPGSPATGFPIDGLDEVGGDDVVVFHAGTKRAHNGTAVTSGGRVLTVVGRGPDLRTAHNRAYAAAEAITFEGRWFRTDIAHRELG